MSRYKDTPLPLFSLKIKDLYAAQVLQITPSGRACGHAADMIFNYPQGTVNQLGSSPHIA